MFNLKTSPDYVGIDKNHPCANTHVVMKYLDGAYSFWLPGSVVMWNLEPATCGTLHLGKGSGIGIGTTIKFDRPEQTLMIGKYNSLGSGIKIILGGKHAMHGISTQPLKCTGSRLRWSGLPWKP